MDKQISRIEEFVNSLTDGKLQPEECIVLSSELSLIGGDNGRGSCTNQDVKACGGVNKRCTNHGVCGTSDNTKNCINKPKIEDIKTTSTETSTTAP